jgi:hypothetical protein
MRRLWATEPSVDLGAASIQTRVSAVRQRKLVTARVIWQSYRQRSKFPRYSARTVWRRCPSE